jgi:hypothetical protein
MGIDLRLYPAWPNEHGFSFNGGMLCIDALSFDRDYDLFACVEGFYRPEGEQRSRARANPMPGPCRIYGDNGIETRKDDSYGEPLTWSTAGELARAMKDVDTSHRNKAIVAYLAALPPEYPIVLYWH